MSVSQADPKVRSAEVRQVLERDRSQRGERMILFVAPGSAEVAFVATRRLGGAVVRNRARRILRAAWRQVAPQVGGRFDVVLVARQGIRGTKTQDVVTEMAELLRRAEVTRA